MHNLMAVQPNTALLEKLVKNNLDPSTRDWLVEKISTIVSNKSVKDIYFIYSLLARKVANETLTSLDSSDWENYLKVQGATVLEMSRVFFLTALLNNDRNFFAPKVKKIISVADSIELETFLKYLILLPHAEDYKAVAVDALRTNIATVFDALALYNPYPAQYFDDKQWNQMFLKAAFMQRPLDKIPSIDERANADLARIISDYAHERWAAGREIDPYFWRPVSPFMNETLLADMQHLFNSEDPIRQKTAAICCVRSSFAKAENLLKKYPKLNEMTKNNQLNWNTLYN